MHDPARELDIEMERYDQMIADEDPPAYGNNGRRLSAAGLDTQMAAARKCKLDAMITHAQATNRLEERKEALAFVEAMAIDEWLGSIPADQLKLRYGSNDTDRGRNTLIYLRGHQATRQCRDEVSSAESEQNVAFAEMERCKDEVEHLRVLALAYGGECQREAARTAK